MLNKNKKFNRDVLRRLVASTVKVTLNFTNEFDLKTVKEYEGVVEGILDVWCEKPISEYQPLLKIKCHTILDKIKTLNLG